jgi:hypothetical protein
MMKRAAVLAFLTLIIVSHALSLPAGSDNQIAYPTGYRQWAHVKSALIGPASPIYKRYGGLHHIYANEKALLGYRGGRFEDGAVIVFDVLEIQETAAGVSSEGARRFIDVMVKDSQRFADTGGWGFEEFNGDSQSERVLTAQAKVACYNCHTQRKEQGFVFSSLRK